MMRKKTRLQLDDWIIIVAVLSILLVIPQIGNYIQGVVETVFGTVLSIGPYIQVVAVAAITFAFIRVQISISKQDEGRRLKKLSKDKKRKNKVEPDEYI